VFCWFHGRPPALLDASEGGVSANMANGQVSYTVNRKFAPTLAQNSVDASCKMHDSDVSP